MALDAAFRRKGFALQRYGVVYVIAPDVTQAGWEQSDVEVQQAADDGAGAPNVGTVATIRRLPPIPQSGQAVAIDLPKDAIRRHWRHRFVRPGHAEGAWSAFLQTPAGTGTYGAIPAPFSDGFTPQAVSQVVGQLSFAASLPPKVASVAGVGTMTIRRRFPATILHDDTPSVPGLSRGIGTIVPAAAASTVTATGGIVLPDGATIIEVSARLTRKNSADIAKAEWYRIADAGTATLIATTEVTSPSGSAQTVSTSVTEAISSTQYVVRATLRGDALNNDAAAVWLEVRFTIPNLGIL